MAVCAQHSCLCLLFIHSAHFHPPRVPGSSQTLRYPLNPCSPHRLSRFLGLWVSSLLWVELCPCKRYAELSAPEIYLEHSLC